MGNPFHYNRHPRVKVIICKCNYEKIINIYSLIKELNWTGLLTQTSFYYFFKLICENEYSNLKRKRKWEYSCYYHLKEFHQPQHLCNPMCMPFLYFPSHTFHKSSTKINPIFVKYNVWNSRSYYTFFFYYHFNSEYVFVTNCLNNI